MLHSAAVAAPMWQHHPSTTHCHMHFRYTGRHLLISPKITVAPYCLCCTPPLRAACYQRLGRYLLAAADCRSVLALHDAHPKALFRLGQALVGSRQLEQAVEALGGAARLTPNDAGVRGERALGRAVEALGGATRFDEDVRGEGAK